MPDSEAATHQDDAGTHQTDVTPRTAGATRLRGIRRGAVIALVASLAITALIGILVLLGSDFGDAQMRVLLTTLLVAGFSGVVLCHLAIAARAVRVVGFVGLVVSAIALVLGVVTIWLPWSPEVGGFLDVVSRGFLIAGVGAVSLAHANLLLLLAGRRHPAVRVALGITLAAVAAVAVLILVPVLTEWPSNLDYWRVLGIVAIIDALGTIVLPVIGALLRDRPEAVVQSELERRIAGLSTATGLDRDTLLAAALDAFEAAQASGSRTP
ncbi:hypothetical protein FLP10_12375 [Agromyces intestinalis]|uniref:Uncharacterized protein n=1 Tax=Agromyces intestinalis TaxID=2592652 RepID=A0A5C1YHN5_9MICO|nr:hypothetical protein [Agromyces intestinalis]QEO15118.1 hypothetical protein FLP10_12375 [Agromyces intestinalis]